MCAYKYSVEGEPPAFCTLGQKISDLPIDNNGFCIFHSNDWKWKKQLEFFNYLKIYKELSQKSGNRMDLQGVGFIAESGKKSIDYIALLSGAHLQGSCFKDTVKIVGRSNSKKIIKGTLNFSHCRFEKSLILTACVFKSKLSFSNNFFSSEATNSISIKNCDLEDYFEFSNQEDFAVNFWIEDTHFYKEVFFSNIKANGDEFEISGNFFHWYTSFSECSIVNHFTDFSHNTFKGYAEVSDVSFYGLTLFNGLTVEDRLIISGGETNSVFYGETEFDINPKMIKGQIIFQKVQLSALEKNHLEYLMYLEKVGYRNKKKIVIGSGCIKYRYQTPIKKLKTGINNGYIIEEFTRCFTSFLSNTIQKTIGIEILERNSNGITFFYYSDAHFAKGEFEEIFTEGQNVFFDIMDNKNLSNYVDIPRKNQLNILQTKATQNAIFSKILSQISEKHWGLSDTKVFSNSLLLPNQQEIFAQELHGLLTNIDIDKIVESMITSSEQKMYLNLTLNIAGKIITIGEQNGPVNINSNS